MNDAARFLTTMDLLFQIFESPQVPCDRIASAYFRHHRYIGSKDRNIIAKRTYRALRDAPLYRDVLKSLDVRLCVALDAIRHENATLTSALWGEGKYGPDSLSTYEIRFLKEILKEIGTMSPLRQTGVSDWIVDALSPRYGDETLFLLQDLNTEAPLDLRVNTLISSRKHVLEQFQRDGIQAKPTHYSPIGVRLSKRQPLYAHPLWKQGAIEIQDEGSQLVAALCQVQPGQWVADVCAGAGGKTLALAAGMKNQGRLVALDIHDWRLEDAKKRLHRAGVNNTETVNIDHPKWIKRHAERFDRVLVDAPCSGIGTWRRHPDGRLTLTATMVDELVNKQRQILSRVAELVKPGGRLIYATCSLFPRENQDQVPWILDNIPGFSLIPIETIWKDLGLPWISSREDTLQLTPRHHQTDGFFVAVFERKGKF